MGRSTRTIRKMGLAGGAGLLAVALVAPAVSAAPTSSVDVVKNMVGGSAVGKALDVDFLGRNFTIASTDVTSTVDNVTAKLDSLVNALGSGLSPQTKVTAHPNGGQQQGCATSPLLTLVNQVTGSLPQAVQDLLPRIDAAVGCGTANILGDVTGFNATGTGDVAHINVRLAPAIQGLVAQLKSTLDSAVLNGTVGQLVDSTTQTAQGAVSQITGLLGGIGGLQLPAIVTAKPTETVDALLTQLANQDLVHIAIGASNVINSGDVNNFVSQATDDAGKIEILPNFRGPNTPALVELDIAHTAAKVNVNRLTAAATGQATDAIVTIKSELLPQLPLGLGNGLLNLAQLGGLGIQSTNGELTVAPGQSLHILQGTPLESVIEVGQASQPVKLENGHLQVTAAAATIHLFKNLDSLVPGLGTILGNGSVLGALTNILGPATALTGQAGLGELGTPTSVSGIKLEFAHSQAEAGAVRVEATHTDAAAPAKLPRTGGLDLALPAATLLGGASGLRVLARRRRRA